ncbi:ABC transporter substrate-binding protein [Erysipelothrix inopinata]|uniref:ABC transporter substrate-binding protein n=1 Tax=Erysipelothrix inopinata TaxID=225084 RepID=A0A7G9RWY5_9FIRM|nr:ABC transporter substrate-binding protein [Erysipelothrix inopinata]QNN60110.1 ABC transporter substrate-binding protein [Erysipelothrix inopinata]
MKKLMLTLLASLLVLAGCSSKGSGNTLTVAAPDKLKGDFVAGFSSGAYDAWVMRLMGNLSTGASTHYVDRATGEYKVNPTVVEKLDIKEGENGNKTYSYTLKDGLKWSDGEAITAKDFVFSVLFRSLGEWQNVATMDAGAQDLLGYKAYQDGSSKEFEGVKYIDDKHFELTIDGENLPYYYEQTFAAVTPDPAHAWMKDAKFNANGNGFDNTAEEIAAGVKNVAEKERYAPTVTSGAYKFDSFKDDTAVVVKNDNYAGNFEGEKAKIDKIVVRVVSTDVQVQSLEKGEIDMAPGMIEGKHINKAKELDLPMHTYPRNGFGNIVLKANKFPTDITEVRQAMGFLLDRQEFVNNIAGGYAKVVDGPYGLSQWFYTENQDKIESQLIKYTYNLDEANKLLDKTEFIYEADGKTPFDASKASDTAAYYRHNKDGKQLAVKHFGTEKNDISTLINTQLKPSAAKVGMNFSMDTGDFATLGDYMQGRKENDYNSFNLATSFTAIYDPYTGFHSDWVGRGTNWSDLADSELDNLIMSMRRHEPTDREGFSDDVVKYIVRWNELLPSIPLYSNTYHDIYAKRVEGMDKITPLLNWDQTIEYISIAK